MDHMIINVQYNIGQSHRKDIVSDNYTINRKYEQFF